jgi:peptidylprolyl isomerase
MNSLYVNKIQNWFCYIIMSLLSLCINPLHAQDNKASKPVDKYSNNKKNKNTTMSNQETIVFETNQGVIKIKLKPLQAPKACENFTALVKNGYYDGLIFHRIIKGFMIQGGDPTGTGRAGTSIWGKPFEDEVSSDLKFDKPGLLAMANSGPNTNGSQFFITSATTPWLNMKHTIFGEVIEGYEVVQKIETYNTSHMNKTKPKNEQKIIKAYVQKR